jgi:hypothetical protein
MVISLPTNPGGGGDKDTWATAAKAFLSKASCPLVPFKTTELPDIRPF